MELFPDDDDLTECVQWTNGAIFGAVATFITTNHGEAQLDEIIKVYGCIRDVFTEMVDTYGGLDLERYTEDFLVRVGADVQEESP